MNSNNFGLVSRYTLTCYGVGVLTRWRRRAIIPSVAPPESLLGVTRVSFFLDKGPREKWRMAIGKAGIAHEPTSSGKV